MIDIRILGPLEAYLDDRPVPTGPPQQRALLGLLALRPGQIVSVDFIIDALWGDEPPSTATNIIQGYVARLRAALEPRRPSGHPPTVLVTQSPGYVLNLPPEGTDAGRFTQHLDDARKLRDRDPQASARILREALGLWRGDVLADVGDLASIVSARAHFAELRRTAIDERIDADLAAGEGASLVPELELLTAEDPLRERTHGQLMLALYRAGRQSDALAAFERARQLLANELGLDPGPELKALETAILRHDLPAPRRAGRGQLPAPLTSFVGRREEIDRVRALLAENRLVTLAGTGGCGKTRLALEVVDSNFVDGNSFDPVLVDLVPVIDDVHVAGAALGALGLRQTPDRAAFDQIVDSIGNAPTLLILDNCEHVLDGCAALASAVLRACPTARILATSRQPLGVIGEAVMPVSGLAEDDALRLFAERSASPVPTSATGSVARICRRLDGIPLAIELAASRTRVLSAGEIESRLGDRFDDFGPPQRGGPARHRTLTAVINWSYDLLSQREREVFEKLSVFPSGFGAAAAEAVADRPDTLDILAELVDKSIVVREDGMDGLSRFRLLSTLRHYARDRLDERGGAEAARRRFIEYYAATSSRLTPLVAGPMPDRWMDRLEEEAPNLRLAVRAALDVGDVSAAATVIGCVWRLWWSFGPITEALDLLETVLAHHVDPSPPVRARLLYGVAACAMVLGDINKAETASRECLEVSEAQHDDLGALWGAGCLSLVSWAQADYAAAERYGRQALVLAQRSGDTWHASMNLTNLARLAIHQGDVIRARALLNESIEVARNSGAQVLAFALDQFAGLAWQSGEDEDAKRFAEQARAAYEDAGSPEGVGAALGILARVALRQGDVAQASALQLERLLIYRRNGFRGPLAACLEDLADIAIARHQPGNATRLLAAGETLRKAHGTPLPGAERDHNSDQIATMRAQLGGDFDTAWAEAVAMPLDWALHIAETVASGG